MIDGIKAKVLHLKSDVWRGCQALDFAVSVSSRTGEVLTNKPQLAEHKGLTFKIVPPIDPQGEESCYLLGSLHKFKNQGLHNADDFSVNDIKNVLADLRELHIDPSVTVLENIEFGVNIMLPYSCQTVLDSMISMSNRQFVELKFSGVPNGKRLCRDQYELKIYDKGKLETGTASHILRVELRVKKMKCLNKAVVMLGDLTDKNKLLVLGRMLVKYIQSVVMYGGSFDDLEKYPMPIQIKLMQWTNPNYWSRLTKDQRFKEQKAFDSFSDGTGTAQMKADLLKAISEKWQCLLSVCPSVSQPLKADLLTNVPTFGSETVSGNETVSATFLPTFENETVSKNETVSPKRNGFSNLFTIKIKGEKVAEQQTTKHVGGLEWGVWGENQNFAISRVCECCGVDISDKRPQSVFCSVKCKNRFNNSRRGGSKVAPSVSGAVVIAPMVERSKVEPSKVSPSVSGTVVIAPMVERSKVKPSKVAPSVSGAVVIAPMVERSKVKPSKVAPSVSGAVVIAPMVERSKVKPSKVAPSVSGAVVIAPMVKPIDFMLDWGEESDADFNANLSKWYKPKRKV
jgi:hypothetical protein